MDKRIIGGKVVAENNISEKAAIDRKVGLEQYEGDEKIYRNILENFTRNNKDTLKNLNSAVKTDNIKLAHRLAHSLRGAAGTIGAARLAGAAFRMENLLSPTNTESVSDGGEAFETQMSLLESEYNAVFDELKSFVKENKETGHDLSAINREKTLGLIGRLIPFLETGDAKSLEYLDEIEESFRPAAEAFRLFITQMEQYDFEQAFETIKSIRQFMGQ